MTWKKPDSPFADLDAALKWWLEEHFRKGDESDGCWAIDLYATYLEAARVTGSLPIVSLQSFGRSCMGLVPRSAYMTVRAKDQEQRSGRKYLVAPLKGVAIVSIGKSDNGALAGMRMYKEAQGATSSQQSVGWLSFAKQLEDDKAVLAEWLTSQRLVRCDTEKKAAPSLRNLHAQFLESFNGRYDWGQLRFKRALALLANVRRGDKGARQVADLVVAP